MEKSTARALSIALVAVIVFLAAAIFLRQGTGERVVVENVLIQSESKPVESLLGLSGKQTFIVSPAFFEKHSVNPYMGNAMNLFIIVLKSNDKNAVQLVRVFNPDKTLKYCATNFGNELVEENLTAEQCNQFISDSSNAVKVLIEFPDASVQKPIVAIKGNAITVSTSSFNDLGKASFVALRIMFENAEENLRQTNTLVEQLS